MATYASASVRFGRNSIQLGSNAIAANLCSGVSEDHERLAFVLGYFATQKSLKSWSAFGFEGTCHDIAERIASESNTEVANGTYLNLFEEPGFLHTFHFMEDLFASLLFISISNEKNPSGHLDLLMRFSIHG